VSPRPIPLPDGGGSVVGIDVGGTKVLGALVRVRHEAPPEVEHTLLLPSDAQGADVVGHIVSVARSLVSHAGQEAPAAVGAGLAGLVGTDGRVRRSPNAPGLEGADVAGRLRSATAVPVVIDNDANCVARAAVALRRPAVRHLVAVTLGTGIGGALVVDGDLVRGARGFAGEPGHMVVDPDGPVCPCGQRGCWERYASGSGLEALARQAVLAGRGEGLAGADGTPDGARVTQAAARGVPAALAVLEEFATWVALGVANLVNLVDPELVVLGGGITAAGDVLLEPVRAAMRAHPMAAARRVPIEAAPGGPVAGALGAALAAAAAVWGPTVWGATAPTG
jgi:glucokinase